MTDVLVLHKSIIGEPNEYQLFRIPQEGTIVGLDWTIVSLFTGPAASLAFARGGLQFRTLQFGGVSDWGNQAEDSSLISAIVATGTEEAGGLRTASANKFVPINLRVTQGQELQLFAEGFVNMQTYVDLVVYLIPRGTELDSHLSRVSR